MWISHRNKGEAKMKKQEFDMGDEKITEYTSGREATIIKNDPDTTDIPCMKADKYIESIDTTIGFYSDSELASSDMIYNFSDRAKAFVRDMNIYRYQRKYLISRIADIYSSNDSYGMSTTHMYIIFRDDVMNNIISEYKISKDFYTILAKAVFLYLVNEFNRVDYYKYSELMRYPDRLFYDWDEYYDKEEYKFYDIRKLDDNLDNGVFKIRCMKFLFDRGDNVNNHIQLGVSMYSNLYSNNTSCKNIDFNFDTSSITMIMENIDKINKIKGSY